MSFGRWIHIRMGSMFRYRLIILIAVAITIQSRMQMGCWCSMANLTDVSAHFSWMYNTIRCVMLRLRSSHLLDLTNLILMVVVLPMHSIFWGLQFWRDAPGQELSAGSWVGGLGANSLLVEDHWRGWRALRRNFALVDRAMTFEIFRVIPDDGSRESGENTPCPL